MCQLTPLVESVFGPIRPDHRSPFEALYGSVNLEPWFPDIQTALEMVQYGTNHLSWLYVSAHPPTVLEECCSYLLQLSTTGPMGYGPGWLGFYLSFLALVLHHAPPDLLSRWKITSQSSCSDLCSSQFSLMGRSVRHSKDVVRRLSTCSYGLGFHVATYSPQLPHDL